MLIKSATSTLNLLYYHHNYGTFFMAAKKSGPESTVTRTWFMKVPIFVIFIVLEKRDISSILFHTWCSKYIRSSGLRTGRFHVFAYVKKNLLCNINFHKFPIHNSEYSWRKGVVVFCGKNHSSLFSVSAIHFYKENGLSVTKFCQNIKI